MIGTLLLNRYELLEKIGEGGMGTVYKAKCHLLNRFVAVKILKTELSNDEEFLRRFKREATSIAKLSHQNIVGVLDVGEENNINFIVMEYINGKTLKQVIKDDGRLSSKKTINIVLQIAKALECAHKNNIIHRDIKPDNIMIKEDHTVKVMDFGIAKVADSRTVTNSNKVMGSVRYFSPEQAKGVYVDCRTDIYSLGIVMYEMVTGKVPYNADSAITIAMMHIQEPPTAPKEVITDIPENINQVILKAMEKEPIKRYQTATEMIAILSAIKENPNYIIKVNNDLDDATKIISDLIVPDLKNDSTTVMSKSEIAELTKNKKDSEVLPRNKKPRRNKNAKIIILSIILVMIAGVIGAFTINEMSNKKTTPTVKTVVPKAAVKTPVIEKKSVPSSTGTTQDTTNNTPVYKNSSKIVSPKVSNSDYNKNKQSTNATKSTKVPSVKTSTETTGSSTKVTDKKTTTGTTNTKGTTGSSTDNTGSSTKGSSTGTTGTKGTTGTGTSGSSTGTTGTKGTTGSPTGTTGSGTKGSSTGNTGTTGTNGTTGSSTSTSGSTGK